MSKSQDEESRSQPTESQTDDTPTHSFSPSPEAGSTVDAQSDTDARGKLGDLDPSFEIPGYVINEELGRGGMGLVLAGHDLSLDREVAIKVMLWGQGAGLASTRFVRESKIAAQLAHPSIPPIHALGTTADQSPFLVMKRIRGTTLAELLQDRENPKKTASKYIQIFEQIAQAVGFAHSQGVVHRDLKPANVMVGEFGEVQVMDWGLAKFLRERGQRTRGRGGQDEFERDAFGSETQAGSVLGTPAYMAPEQARGEEVDARADVFALGAILCVILTGKPPFGIGKSLQETLREAAEGAVGDAWARLDTCDADAELVSLTKLCLSPRIEDRPSDAKGVAEAVANYRAAVEERLRKVETERATEEARSLEQRKRRRVVRVAVGVVAVLLVVGTALSTWLAIRARNSEKETREQLEETKRARAGEARKYRLALDAFDDMVFAIQNKLGTHPRTQELRKELLLDARGGLEKLLAEADKQGNPDQKLVWSHFQMGSIERTLGNLEAASQEYRAAHRLAKRLAEANPESMQAQRDLGISHSHLGDLALMLKRTREALDHFEKKVAIDRKLAKAHPNNALIQRDVSAGLGRLGQLALQMGQTQKAHDYYTQKLELAKGLERANPTDPSFRTELAFAYELLGDSSGYLQRWDLALECYKKQSEIVQQLHEGDPENLPMQRRVGVSLMKLGNVHQDLGKSEQALGYYRRAVAIYRQLTEADPKNVQARLELFIGYDSLGFAEESRSEYAEAAEWYRKGRDLLLPLHEEKKLVGQFQNALPRAEAQIASCEKYVRAIEDLEFLLGQPEDEIPNLASVRMRVLANKNDLSGVVETSTAFTKLAEKNPNLNYDAACFWSLASALPKQSQLRDEYATKAIGLLKKTTIGQGKSFPTIAALVSRIQQDADLAPLRERKEFEAFVGSLEERDSGPSAKER